MEDSVRWQVSGDAAERYEVNLVPVIFVPWAEELLRRAVLRRGEAVLDVACGTGIVARMASEAVGEGARVTGADINGGMLAVAARIAPEIEWVNASADALPFGDASFDAVFCQQGLQFFPDKAGALSEFRRVLRPGGRAVLCVARELEVNPLMSSQVAALTRHFGEDSAKSIRAVCGFPDADVIEGLFHKAGFGEVKVESVSLTLRHPNGADFVRGMMTATPRADLLAAMEPEAREALAQDILDGFGEFYDGKALAFPHVSNVIVARV